MAAAYGTSCFYDTFLLEGTYYENEKSTAQRFVQRIDNVVAAFYAAHPSAVDRYGIKSVADERAHENANALIEDEELEQRRLREKRSKRRLKKRRVKETRRSANEVVEASVKATSEDDHEDDDVEIDAPTDHASTREHDTTTPTTQTQMSDAVHIGENDADSMIAECDDECAEFLDDEQIIGWQKWYDNATTFLGPGLCTTMESMFIDAEEPTRVRQRDVSFYHDGI